MIWSIYKEIRTKKSIFSRWYVNGKCHFHNISWEFADWRWSAITPNILNFKEERFMPSSDDINNKLRIQRYLRPHYHGQLLQTMSHVNGKCHFHNISWEFADWRWSAITPNILNFKEERFMPSSDDINNKLRIQRYLRPHYHGQLLQTMPLKVYYRLLNLCNTKFVFWWPSIDIDGYKS